MPFLIEGKQYNSSNELPRASIRIVTMDYFRVLRTPLLLGRCFKVHENPDQPAVVINRRMARSLFPDLQSPIGKRIRFGNLDAKGYRWAEIIGVVGDMSDWLDSNQIPPYQIYLSYAQYPQRNVALAIRTGNDPFEYAATARAIIHSVDPELPVSAIQSMEEIVGERVSGYRMTSRIMSLLSLFALVLSSFGIYSVVSYVISRRTKEIGIRMAFGAAPKNICLMILRSGLLLLGAGLVVGLGAAFASMHYFKALLFGIAPEDLISYIGSAAIIIAVGIAAILLPVRRAVSVDPMVSIRHE
jgi:macrolide transport system ATP-binding/permease protein